jgi:Peptidase C13 family
MRGLARLVLAAGVWLSAASAHAASPFADWSAIVVAGDFHGSGGGPTEAFDNARRDVSQSLRQAGFSAQNLRQFSVRPDRYPDSSPDKTDLRGIYDSMTDLTGRATGGCLIYFTSHGAPQGVVIDQAIMAPATLARMLDQTCGQRPTVVVISACFSGVFMPYLAQPNRMVLTAARPDRTSFGCGETNKYPYFDDCFLSSMPGSADFHGLAAQVRQCVQAREIAEQVKPPSEPQLFVGAQLRPLLPLYAFDRGAP